MCFDNFEDGFSKEQVKDIRKRVSPGIEPTSAREKEFFLFFQEIRKKAELYALVMFNGFKIIDFSKDHDHAVIRDKAGKESKVKLI